MRPLLRHSRQPSPKSDGPSPGLAGLRGNQTAENQPTGTAINLPPGCAKPSGDHATLRRIFTRAVVLVMAAGFGMIAVTGVSVLFYPQFSDFVSNRSQRQTVIACMRTENTQSTVQRQTLLREAQQYNTALAQTGVTVQQRLAQAGRDTAHTDSYWNMLLPQGENAVGQTAAIGVLNIPKIGVELPIYHGTSAAVLASGVGHVPGSSLPVGGASTHAVLAGHTGLPGAELLTRLDELSPGDRFTVTVLGEPRSYQVDQILTVLPSETDALDIEQGKDYVTLVTCTPYGVNDHRLLVRGVRVVQENGAGNVKVEAEASTSGPSGLASRAREWAENALTAVAAALAGLGAGTLRLAGLLA